VVTCFAVATIASVLIYRAVEKPMTRWFQGMTRRKAQQPDKAMLPRHLAGAPAMSGDTRSH
jgi:peptidoglycan/LPS O-acetylase OafA/YrhL